MQLLCLDLSVGKILTNRVKKRDLPCRRNGVSRPQKILHWSFRKKSGAAALGLKGAARKQHHAEQRAAHVAVIHRQRNRGGASGPAPARPAVQRGSGWDDRYGLPRSAIAARASKWWPWQRSNCILMVSAWLRPRRQ